MLSDYLGLPRGSNSVQGQSEALTALLHCIKEGGGGNRRRGTWVSTGILQGDLTMSNNALGNVYYSTVRGTKNLLGGTSLQSSLSDVLVGLTLAQQLQRTDNYELRMSLLARCQ